MAVQCVLVSACRSRRLFSLLASFLQANFSQFGAAVDIAGGRSPDNGVQARRALPDGEMAINGGLAGLRCRFLAAQKPIRRWLE